MRTLLILLLASPAWAVLSHCPRGTTTTNITPTTTSSSTTTTLATCFPGTFTYQTGAIGCGNPNCGAKTKDTYISVTNGDVDAFTRFDGLGLLVGQSFNGYLSFPDFHPVTTDASRALVEFDASDIPPGAIVGDATLTLDVYSGDFPTSAGHICRLRRPDWVEQEATWETYKIPGGTPFFWTTAGASDTLSDIENPGSGSTTCVTYPIQTGASPLAVDVTALTQDALDNRTGKVRFWIAQDDPLDTHFLVAGDSELVFFHNNGDPVQHPKLTVAFGCTPTTTSTSSSTTTLTPTTTLPGGTTSSTSSTTSTSTSSSTSTSTTLAAGLTYWLDATAGVDSPSCGKAQNNPCQTYYYWLNNGCAPTAGCKNDGIPHSGGDTIEFRAGTYHGDGNANTANRTYIAVPFDGTSANPVTYNCFDGNHSCVIDMAGVTGLSANAPALCVGCAINSKTLAGNIATYINFVGFLVAPGANAPTTVHFSTGVANHHLLFDDMIFDAANITSGFSVTFSLNTSFLTIKHSVLKNQNVDGGAELRADRVTNLALIGNMLGPSTSTGNTDCANMINVGTGLEDGNTCHDHGDGMDGGMDADTPAFTQTIRRYNMVYDVGGNSTGSRCFPSSGNGPTALSGQNAIYKNLCYQTRSLVNAAGSTLYNNAIETLWFNNTVALNSGGSPMLYGVGANNPFVYDNFIGNNIISDTLAANDMTMLYSGSGGGTIACSATHPCPYTKNIFWSPEHGTGQCATWQPSDAGQTLYTCAQLGTTFNSLPGHSGNQHIDPVFTTRDPGGIAGSAADFVLQPSSPAIDIGDPFCRTVGAASGNTMTVSCTGIINDPRYWFPQPSDYYRVVNSDCVGYGTRTVDGASGGCFDIQIEGACGVRAVVSETASTITFDGASCSWADGAMVHVPWNGAGPDAGALEAPLGTTSTTAAPTTTTSTTSTSTSSTTSTSTSSTTSTSSSTTSTSSSTTTSTSDTTPTTTSTSTTTTTSTSTTSTTLAPTIQVLSVGATVAQANNATQYLGVTGYSSPWNGTEVNARQVMAAPGQLGNLRVVVPTAPGVGASWTFTLLVNGTPSALTCAISGASATTCQDTTGAHAVAISAGDQVDYKSVPSGTPTAATARLSTLWKPTTADDTVWPMNTTIGVNTGADTMVPLSGFGAVQNGQGVVPLGGTAKNLYAWCSAAAAGGSTRVFTFTLGATGQALACTMNPGDTTCNHTGDPVTLAAGNLVSLNYTATGTPGSAVCGVGVVFVPTSTGQFVAGMYISATNDTPTTATNKFAALSAQRFAMATTEDAIVQRLGQAMTMKTIAVALNLALGTGSTVTFTLDDGTATPTAETCTISGNSATTCTGTADVSIADDDLLATVVAHTGSAGSARTVQISYGAVFTGTFP